MFYQIVDEFVIASAAEECKYDNPNNSFSTALKIANEYKIADLTPVFILNSRTKTIHITTEEAMNGKFH